MSETKISVIITAFNIENYVSDCLESVQLQRFDDMEIICVDDASTDKTVAVIQKKMCNDKRIKLVKMHENSGPAAARNAGCRRAVGKYIFFLDGDDYIKEGMFEELYSIAELNELDVLSFSGEAFVDENFAEGQKYNSYKDHYKRKTIFNGVFEGPELYAQYMDRDENNGNLYLQFIKRSMYVENNLYANESLKYDNDSPFGVYMYAKRAMCIPSVFYMRRYRPNSRVTSEMSFEKAECIMLRIYLELCIWQSMELPERINKSIEKHFISAQKSLQHMLHGINIDNERIEYRILQKYPAARYLMGYFILRKSLYRGLTSDTIGKLRTCEKRIVIYGTGLVAEDVAEMLEKSGITDYIPVVTRKTDLKLFRNKEVYEFEELGVDWGESVVIVAVSDKYKEEIRKRLNQNKVKMIIEV